LRVGELLLADELEGDGSAEGGVPGAPDLAEGTLADRLAEDVLAQLYAGDERRRGGQGRCECAAGCRVRVGLAALFSINYT
jgi:hypothetical protein